MWSVGTPEFQARTHRNGSDHAVHPRFCRRDGLDHAVHRHLRRRNDSDSVDFRHAFVAAGLNRPCTPASAAVERWTSPSPSENPRGDIVNLRSNGLCAEKRGVLEPACPHAARPTPTSRPPCVATASAPSASRRTSRTAAHSSTRNRSPRTTKLYDRTNDQITLDEIEPCVFSCVARQRHSRGRGTQGRHRSRIP
jgi:hypothetical protein